MSHFKQWEADLLDIFEAKENQSLANQVQAAKKYMESVTEKER